MYKSMRKISIDEMNEKLNELKKSKCRIFLFREPEVKMNENGKREQETIGLFKVFLFKKISTCHLIYKDYKTGMVTEYSTHLDRDFDGITKNGAQAFSILQKYFKAPEVNNKENAPFAIGIAPYKNPKYVGKRIENCFGYDLNSAYPFGMLQDMPDTTKPLGAGIVKKNEYGFSFTGDKVSIGKYAKYRFPIMKTPYEKFVEIWYGKKKAAKTTAEKNEAKFVLNASIGALQNHNCFLRAAIINNFHQFILNIFYKYKKYILGMTVDSITSMIRIPELEANLGSEIGQWKLEHTGSYAIHSNGYSSQWNYEPPAFGAGIPKSWFKDGYDILNDPLPIPNNKYDINYNKKQIVIKKVQNEDN